MGWTSMSLAIRTKILTISQI
jgi:hypothetical protein